MTRVLVALVLAGASLASAEEGTFLHGVPLEVAVTGPVEWSKVQLELSLRDETLRPLYLVRAKAVPSDAGVYTLPLSTSGASDPPSKRQRSSSWVVDYADKGFAPVLAALAADAGPKPSVPALISFADHYISKKSLGRGFDIASQVARSHEGDCSEHAVFLAAILRHAGFSTRVMLGVVLVLVAGKPAAYGHAWTEVWREGAWQIADAALTAPVSPVYLPVAEIVDEGPAYALSMAGWLPALGFKQLRLVPKP